MATARAIASSSCPSVWAVKKTPAHRSGVTDHRNGDPQEHALGRARPSAKGDEHATTRRHGRQIERGQRQRRRNPDQPQTPGIADEAHGGRREAHGQALGGRRKADLGGAQAPFVRQRAQEHGQHAGEHQRIDPDADGRRRLEAGERRPDRLVNEVIGARSADCSRVCARFARAGRFGVCGHQPMISHPWSACASDGLGRTS
jgi:hypothetical protein